MIDEYPSLRDVALRLAPRGVLRRALLQVRMARIMRQHFTENELRELEAFAARLPDSERETLALGWPERVSDRAPDPERLRQLLDMTGDV